MRSIESTRDVYGVRYTDKLARIRRLQRVNEVEKKEKIKPVGEYEKRGMTEEDKERKISMTPQEAFRREMAQTQNSRIYAKLQNQENEKNNENQQSANEKNKNEIEELEPEI